MATKREEVIVDFVLGDNTLATQLRCPEVAIRQAVAFPHGVVQVVARLLFLLIFWEELVRGFHNPSPVIHISMHKNE